MEKSITSYANNIVSLIVSRLDMKNNTYTLKPEAVSFGKIDDLGFFHSEDGEYVVPSITNDSIDDSSVEYFYAFDVNYDEIKDKYPDVRDYSTLLRAYFEDVASDLLVAVKSQGNINVFRKSYSAIDESIQGGLLKEVAEEGTANINLNAEFDYTRIDVNEIERQIKAHVLENDEIVENMLTTILMNLRVKNKYAMQSMLSIGPTGSGKTLTYEKISEYLNIPYTKFDCTILSAAGYKGSDLEDILRSVVKSAKGNIKAAERSILMLDEVDKLALKGHSVSDECVQQQLLSMLTGSTYHFLSEQGKGMPIALDTSFITIGACGAFADIMKNKEKKICGFASQEEIQKTPNYEITDEDLVNYGMIPEFVGRFINRFVYKKLDHDSYRRILLESASSPLLIHRDLYRDLFGVDVVFPDEFIEALLCKMDESIFGARSLHSYVAKLFKRIDGELLRGTTHGKQLILKSDLVDNYKSFDL